MLAGAFVLAQGVFAQDGVRTLHLDSIVVTSTRAGATTPMVYTNLNAERIAKENFGQDMPFLLLTTPSVVATSDAGAGIGYTGLRIRGTDATRINVTLDGVPMNDAESHGLFWVNTPDIASSAGSIQVQRGVGTSTNGAGAFGGSVNILSERPSQQPYGEFAGSYGSFNTHKETFKIGSGLLKDHWTLDVRLSNIHSDGYVDRAETDLRSYMARAGYQTRNTALSFMVMGGKERTYHAWDGVTTNQMEEYGRTYNPCGEMWEYVYNDDGSRVMTDDPEYPQPVTRWAGNYKDNTDNYELTNYHLHLFQDLGRGWTLNAALHYYKGDGYYEEFKNGAKLEEYALCPFVIAGEEVKKTNLVRRKMMDNWFGGGVFSLNYKDRRIEAALGGATNRYDGDHYGRVMWVENYVGSFGPEHRYYEGNGTKDDANIYAKASWEALDDLFIYGDLQFRHIGYRITGTNDTFDGNTGEQSLLDVDKKFDFFNPKAGVFYKLNRNINIYASVAVAHREPTRNNYTEAPRVVDGVAIAPRAERLTDFEIGGSWSCERLTAGVNVYYMKYKDQLVLTGETNDIGEPLAENVADSYRAGIELTAGVKIAPWLRWDVHATFSQNRIDNFTEYAALYDNIDDWNYVGQQAENLGTVDISFSPSVLAGSLISAHYGRWNAALQTNYVGRQFVTNSNKKALSLDAYSTTNLRVDYTLGYATLGVAVNNLFDARYCSNGWGYSSLFEDGTPRYDSMYYFPQAGINALANLTIRF